MSNRENITQTMDVPVFSKRIQSRPLLGTKLDWLILTLSVLVVAGFIFLAVLNFRAFKEKSEMVVPVSPTPTPTLVETGNPIQVSGSELRESWLGIERSLNELDFRQSGLEPPSVDLDIGLEPEMF